MQSKLLTAIYTQHPDLEPQYEEAEEPTISSHLTWDQVRLPPGISEADVDAIIFSFMKPRWQKVARIIGQSLGRCRELGLDMGDEAFGARIRALGEADRIETVGDLRKWRWSEVRLKV